MHLSPTRRPALLRHAGFASAFTLVEVLVSTALLALIMTLLLSTVNQTSMVWSRATSKVSQFQSSRNAFEQITRSISQATLNTYYQLDPPRTQSPTDFIRASDLHFASGPATLFLTGSESLHPTHGIFFHAPLGATDKADTANPSTRAYEKLDNLLNALGYFIEWGDDTTRPGFLPAAGRYRYRLLEARQPAEQMAIYTMNDANQADLDAGRTPRFKATDWIKVACKETVAGYTAAASPEAQPRPRVMAENIIALVIVPKVSPGDRTFENGAEKIDLAPNYRYDSRPADASGRTLPWSGIKSDPVKRNWFCQMPPIVQVSMVAIDEASAQRFNKSGAPDWASGLFSGNPSLRTTEDIKKDFAALEARLTDARVNYRIFTADVVVRGSKFSKPDRN